MIKIIGAGGFASEVIKYATRDFEVYVDDEYYHSRSIPFARPLSNDDGNGFYVIAIGDPSLRRRKYVELGRPRLSWLHSDTAIVGASDIADGSILCDYSVVTDNVTIGEHCHLNLHVSIGHDCVIGDFFTASPGARVSGNCVIGNGVFLGTNAVVNPGLSICDNVIIGSGCVVTKDIVESGTYIGIPARKI